MLRLIVVINICIFSTISSVFGAGGAAGYKLPPVERLGEVVSYTYAGNHKLAVYIPKYSKEHRRYKKKYPVIVFNYDEVVDKLGEPYAAKQGYKINKFVKDFASKGYATIVPLTRYSNSYSAQAAITYAVRHSKLDSKNVHLFGHSAGAFLNLLAATKHPYVTSLFLIAPYAPDDTGFHSTVQLKRDVNALTHIPMVIIDSDLMHKNQLRSVSRIRFILQSNVDDVTYKTYPYEMKYFWNSKSSYMEDFWALVKKSSGVTNENKNSY
jgi:pimeloyl-ACP methyl ester carboxylesterase